MTSIGKLCLTLAEESLSTLERKVAQHSGRVPVIEIRLDYLARPEVPPLPGNTSTEFVATCRAAREGGRYKGSEGDRLALLKKAAESGFTWLDLEHDVEEDPSLPTATRVVRSYHCFGSFPESLPALLERMRAQRAEVIKLAVNVSGTGELVTLLSFMESFPSETPHIVLGMGSFGQSSRTLGVFLGNYWTYVAAAEEDAAAPGQFSLKKALDWYRLPSWVSAPPIYGVLGNPVAHSMSPQLHNHLFGHYRLKKVYFPFLLDCLDPWFDYVARSRLSFSGFSVTLPFKADVVKHVSLESAADVLNTLIRVDSHWEGSNTDYAGFLKPLQSRFDLKGKTAVVLGHGGVAHTVLAALRREGAQVVVVGRSRQRAAQFAARYGCRHAHFSDLPLRADLCVNATPVGQYPQVEDSPLLENQLDFGYVYDLVYHPEETRLLRMAAKKGILTISGIEMFVEQAALQFLAWTRIEPERELVREMIREISTESSDP